MYSEVDTRTDVDLTRLLSFSERLDYIKTPDLTTDLPTLRHFVSSKLRRAIPYYIQLHNFIYI
jgi:hypothetical protein